MVAYRVDSYNDETGETLPMPWSLDADAFPADRVSSPGDNPDKLFYAFQNWTWNKLFRSSFVQASGLRFHEVQRSADLYFVCCALAQADRVATVDEVLYHYRVNNPNSNIATNERAPLDFYRSFVAVKQHLENVGRFAAVERGFKNWAAESVFFNLCSLKARDAFEELRREMQQRGCVELGLDTMKKAEFFDPRTYDQVRHLLCDDADDFLFFLLRETNRRMEEQRTIALRDLARSRGIARIEDATASARPSSNPRKRSSAVNGARPPAREARSTGCPYRGSGSRTDPPCSKNCGHFSCIRARSRSQRCIFEGSPSSRPRDTNSLWYSFAYGVNVTE